MLNKLSSTLKKGFDKIAGSVFLDKKTIDSVVKDLQRALIQADVNVHLIKQLGDKIKKEAKNEKIKGIERKEHLTKVLHDEIINLLGGEKNTLTLKKQTKIMLLGLYGSGKCVHAKSKVLLDNGEYSKIKNIYERQSIGETKQILEDGEVIKLSKDIYAKSFNPKTLKIEDKKITRLWKLKKEELYEIGLDNGNDYSIKVTPEHPFFVLRNGKIVKTRADELLDSDYIATPREIKINGKLQSLFNKIRKQNLDIYLTTEEIKKYSNYKNKTLKGACKNLENKRNYCALTYHTKRGRIPIELIKKEIPNIIKIKDKTSKKIITFPTTLTRELAEFLGYLMGDGNIRPNYAQISNEDSKIISRIKELSKDIFNIEPIIKKAKRTKNLYDIRICSKTLVNLLSIFNLKSGKKGKKLKIPEEILLSDNETVRAFVKAYFDCDSLPSYNRRQIELTSESHILIEQMNILLKRFCITSTISKKIINKIPYWRLTIRSKSAEKYADKIGFLIFKKQNKANKFKDYGLIQGSGKEDIIPLGKLLKETRIANGFSIGEIQTNAVYSYERYEEMGLISREKLQKLINYYKQKKKGMFLNLLTSIKNNSIKENYKTPQINGLLHQLKNWNIIQNNSNKIILTNNGETFLQKIQETNSIELIEFLDNLSNSNVYWSEINKITPIKNDEEYVYDLTIEDNHSFIADGFIVHNTTTTSKLASYYQKRGYKTALLGLDVHRPAATDQLEQLGKKIKIPVFTDKKEKDAKKIYKKYKKDLEKYDLIIIDTAGRHSLDTALVKEIKSLNKTIKPDHTLLTIQADIGQAAKQQASEFQKACNVNGVIITRMDSTAKAGGALTACNETSAPVFFIGTGENPSDLEIFNPKSFVSRLLGLGDLEGLLEHVQSAVDKQSQKKLKSKFEKGDFNLRDFQQQLGQMQGMGSLSKITEMIPGMGNKKIPENALEGQEEQMKKWKHAIDSMTEQEKENPDIIETSRLKRIAKGSGTTTTDIRKLIKQYKMIKELTQGGELEKMDPSQGLSQKQMMKLAKKFGRKMKF